MHKLALNRHHNRTHNPGVQVTSWIVGNRYLIALRQSCSSLGNNGRECHQIPRCLRKIVPRKSCARSAKGYSYLRATMGSTRMARRAGI